MRVLVDTQCWLWMHSEPERLPDRVRGALADSQTDILLSAASVWELAIKMRIGKVRLPLPLPEYVATRLPLARTSILPIDQYHAARVAELPLHHRDPFDRMLVAQSQIEHLAIATVDPEIRRYDVELL